MKPLTEPMLVTLIGIGSPRPSWARWYPAGQRRLILQALMDRELIERVHVDHHQRLQVTEAGREILALVRDAEVVDTDG